MPRMAARGRYYPPIGAQSRSSSFASITGTVSKSLSNLTSSASATTLTWNNSSPIPSPLDFVAGSTTAYDLKQHIQGFNTSLNSVVLKTGTLPGWLPLSSDGVLTPDGTQTGSTSWPGVSFEIINNADSDFLTRSTSPGVIRSFGFNSSGDLGGSYGSNYGTVSGTGTVGLDPSVKASGASSLRFDVTTSGNSCNWFTNFSSDLSKIYRGNSEFYIQWKMRISRSVVEDWGHKYVLIGSGDDGTNLYSSCTDLEIEMGSYTPSTVTPETQFPIMYNACPGSCGGVFPFYEPMGGGDFKLQNAIPSPFCRYQDATKANCVHPIADQWMVIQVGVQLGPRISALNSSGGGPHYWFSGSRVRTWLQLSPTSPEVLISDWVTGTTPGSQVGLCAGHGAVGNQGYGKIWLLPYTQVSVASPRAGTVWYDELIISEQKIPAAQA